VDARFAHAREQMRSFQSVQPLHETESFRGTLRGYQRDGLGWIDFLRTFTMGGVLADDMGLGKTIQVLASLVARYRDGRNGDGAGNTGNELPAPSVTETASDIAVAAATTSDIEHQTHRTTLVVAPRSVVFNWIDEAERFAPGLRVGNYTGVARHELRHNLHEYDLLVTSYGLMRRDIAELSRLRFDYVILDEAQAIKNPNALAAKAARLLRCEHRLALTGTPVENHLGDLWSIFEFLNPGMLGSGARFGKWLRGAEKRGRPANDAPPRAGQLGGRAMATDVDVARQAGQALRPFILRRTKSQVLSELPDKIEQTIVCTMPAAQRKVYDELL
jgi:SNF2 family DNA or RNA helicase